MPITPDKLAQELLEVDQLVDDLKELYEEATRWRADLMLEAVDGGENTRGDVARHLDKSPERVRQIIDRRQAARARGE
jgi:cell shape-determining protein MreC